MERIIHVLIFVGALQALFFAGLIGLKRPMQRFNLWLFILLLCIGLSQLLHFLRWDGYLATYMPFLLRTRFLFPAFIGPLFYVFVSSVTGQHLQKKQIAFFMIPGIVNILLLLPYLLLSAETKVANQFSELYPFNYYGVYLIARTSLIGFALKAHHLLRQFPQSPDWLKKVTLFLVIHSIILATINIIDFFLYEFTSYYYINLASTFLVFVIVYFTIRHSRIYHEEVQPQKPVNRYQKSGLSVAKARVLLQSLDQLMVEEHLYRQQGLTQAQVANAIGVSSNHLSQALNEQRSQKFTDYLNGHRIGDVKRRMADRKNRHLTLLAMAEQSGFGSKASFNTVFRKQTGQTPTQYFKSIGSIVQE